MNQSISPKYQMSIVQKITDSLFEQFTSYENVEAYLNKWHQVEHDDLIISGRTSSFIIGMRQKRK